MATDGGKEAVKRSRLSIPLLALLVFVDLGVACRPTGQADPKTSSATASVTSELPSPLDPAPAREIVLGKLFAPDGSIEAADRTANFVHGTPIFLSVESGDLLRGTSVAAVWAAPDGTVTEQKQTAIGGESYLVFTAPSAGWPPGAGHVVVRIGEPPSESLRREVPFEIAPQ